jgi:hypothetical protein
MHEFLFKKRLWPHIQDELKEGMTASEIYRHAFLLLKKQTVPHASRCSSKQAITDLSTIGYFFIVTHNGDVVLNK